MRDSLLILGLCAAIGWTVNGLADGWNQPLPNGVYECVAPQVMDGDTLKVDIILSTVPDVRLHGAKLRLRGVHAYEIGKGTPEEQKTAEMERQALSRIVLSAKKLTCRIHKTTYDRYEAELWSDTQDICAAMQAYPQGGR